MSTKHNPSDNHDDETRRTVSPSTEPDIVSQPDTDDNAKSNAPYGGADAIDTSDDA